MIFIFWQFAEKETPQPKPDRNFPSFHHNYSNFNRVRIDSPIRINSPQPLAYMMWITVLGSEIWCSVHTVLGRGEYDMVVVRSEWILVSGWLRYKSNVNKIQSWYFLLPKQAKPPKEVEFQGLSEHKDKNLIITGNTM